MPGAGRVIWQGEPGAVWVNETGRAQYQFHCRRHHTCGLCFQYDRAIAPTWPIPLHAGCQCWTRPIYPGQSAAPFVDFRAEIRRLPRHEQAEVVGAANWRLVESGTVTWSEVVTPNRVRDLREVVSRLQLTVPRMVDAGVPRSVAERAFASVHTDAHVLAAQKRAELLQKLERAGLSHARVGAAAADRLAARVVLPGRPGPAGAGRAAALKPGPRPEINPEARAGALKKLGVRPEAAEAAGAAARRADEEKKKAAAEAAGRKAEAEAGAPAVEVHGAPSAGAVAAARAAAAALPAKVRKALDDHGVVFAAADVLTDAAPSLAGVRPRGWAEGLTWENADGLYTTSHPGLPARRVLVCERLKRGDRVVKTNRFLGVLHHETGHALDESLGFPSNSSRFRAAHDADSAKLGEEARAACAYYLQAGGAGRSEAFAELFAQEVGAGAMYWRDLRRDFPRTAEVIRGLIR